MKLKLNSFEVQEFTKGKPFKLSMVVKGKNQKWIGDTEVFDWYYIFKYIKTKELFCLYYDTSQKYVRKLTDLELNKVLIYSRSINKKELNFTKLKDFARKYKAEILLNTCIYKNNANFQKLIDFFKYHPNYSERFPLGINYFKNIENKDGYSQNKNNIAWLVYGNDGNSFILSCNFSKNGKNKLNKLKIAMRNAIYPEIIKFRNQKFIATFSKCCFCDKPINSTEDLHIDHNNLKFNEIVKQFIKLENLDYKKIKITKNNTDGLKYSRFEDTHLQAKFILFHNKNTNLRLSHCSCNIKNKK